MFTSMCVWMNLTTIRFVIFMRDLFSRFASRELFTKLKPQNFHWPWWANHISIRQYFQLSSHSNCYCSSQSDNRTKEQTGRWHKAENKSALTSMNGRGMKLLDSPAVPAYPFSPYTNNEQGTKSQDYHLSPQTTLDIHSTFSHPAN